MYLEAVTARLREGGSQVVGAADRDLADVTRSALLLSRQRATRLTPSPRSNGF